MLIDGPGNGSRSSLTQFTNDTSMVSSWSFTSLTSTPTNIKAIGLFIMDHDLANITFNVTYNDDSFEVFEGEEGVVDGKYFFAIQAPGNRSIASITFTTREAANNNMGFDHCRFSWSTTVRAKFIMCLHVYQRLC